MWVLKSTMPKKTKTSRVTRNVKAKATNLEWNQFAFLDTIQHWSPSSAKKFDDGINVFTDYTCHGHSHSPLKRGNPHDNNTIVIIKHRHETYF